MSIFTPKPNQVHIRVYSTQEENKKSQKKKLKKEKEMTRSDSLPDSWSKGLSRISNEIHGEFKWHSKGAMGSRF